MLQLHLGRGRENQGIQLFCPCDIDSPVEQCLTDSALGTVIDDVDALFATFQSKSQEQHGDGQVLCFVLVNRTQMTAGR